MLENAANSRRYVDRFFAEQGVTLVPEIELGAHELLPSFAAIGFGLACVVQEFCQKALKEDMVFPVDLSPAIPPRAIGACWLQVCPWARRQLLRLMEEKKADVIIGCGLRCLTVATTKSLLAKI